MWISKDEYNLLVQNSELGAKNAMKLAEVLADLYNTKTELIQVKRELDDVKDYANHLRTSRDEVIEGYNAKIKSLIFARDEFERQLKGTQAAYESEHAEATEYFNEYYKTKKELDRLKRELTHTEVDLVLYKKAFDDIAHAFGDEFRYLLMKEAVVEEQHPVEARYATWVVSDLWFVVHDIMKNAGWRGKDADN